MSSALSTLGRWAFRARRLVLTLWIVALAVLVTVAGLLGTGTDNTYRIPGTESQDALDALARTFPQFSGTSAQLIAVAPAGGDVTAPEFQTPVESAVTAIAAIPQVSGATSPYASASSPNISTDDSAVLVPIQLSVGTTSVLPETSQALQDAGAALQDALPAGSQVAVGGQLFSQSAAGIGVTELIGIAVAFGVLLVTFASFAAAGMPLVTALLGAGASLAIVYVGTRSHTITSTTPLLALMLGLAVGIDYALFIMSRHQDQLKHGLEPEESASRAVATAGSAVVFAATTVVIALLGLSVAGIPFLTTMGVAAAIAVSMAVLVSMTLTPALLGFAGWRVAPKRFRPGSPPPSRDADDDGERPVPKPGTALRWVRLVTRWPIVTVLVVVVALGVAAIPVTVLRLALPDAGSLEEDAPARITYDLIAVHFGPGYNGPLVMTGSVIQSTDPVGVVNDIAAEVAGLPGVASVPLATPNEDGDTAVIQVVPEGGPDSEATKALVGELRSQHDRFLREYGVGLAVTGYTAAGIDISAQLAEALLPFGLLIVGLSLVLLAMVFRSVVVPVTAALGYVLSLLAALGLTALVFVDGVLAGPLNVASVGAVISFMPIILMGVLFGLAMDYEVFLVSRMREDYVHHGDHAQAIEHGFVGSARVVTAAAIIMVAVFAAFIPEGDAAIQPIAFGLAVGVAIDAFVVRMTFIPAVLALFGDRAWWIPAWLDRVLPRFDVEGEGLAQELALADWPEGEELAIAAEGMRVGGLDGVDLRVGTGDVLVVRGGTPEARRAVLLGLGGRVPVTDGRVKVTGLVLPPRAATVRRRTSYVDLGGPADLRAALRTPASILLVDGVDRLADPEVRETVRRLLTDAVGSRPLTLVVACRSDAVVDDVLPAERTVHTLALDRAPAGVA
ncbi:MAG: MMPL family transporter [Cellulomonas sp.]